MAVGANLFQLPTLTLGLAAVLAMALLSLLQLHLGFANALLATIRSRCANAPHG
jgi:hypothetical protein